MSVQGVAAIEPADGLMVLCWCGVADCCRPGAGILTSTVTAKAGANLWVELHFIVSGSNPEAI